MIEKFMREVNNWLPHAQPPLGIEPTMRAYALTKNRIGDLLVPGSMLKH